MLQKNMGWQSQVQLIDLVQLALVGDVVAHRGVVVHAARAHVSCFKKSFSYNKKQYFEVWQLRKLERLAQ